MGLSDRIGIHLYHKEVRFVRWPGPHLCAPGPGIIGPGPLHRTAQILQQQTASRHIRRQRQQHDHNHAHFRRCFPCHTPNNYHCSIYDQQDVHNVIIIHKVLYMVRPPWEYSGSPCYIGADHVWTIIISHDRYDVDWSAIIQIQSQVSKHGNTTKSSQHVGNIEQQ